MFGKTRERMEREISELQRKVWGLSRAYSIQHDAIKDLRTQMKLLYEHFGFDIKEVPTHKVLVGRGKVEKQ